jgi:hypothetical protein
MPDPSLAFAFAAPVLRLEDAFRYHYLPLPDDVAAAYEAAGVRRLIATLNGHAFRRAVQGREGGRCLIVGLPILRAIGAAYGDAVAVELRPDPDPGAVDLGPEFEAALDQDEAAAARFYAMTPGRQRSLAYYVTSAKREETRIKRALELAHKLRTHTLYGDRPPAQR